MAQNANQFPWGMTGCRFPSVAALTVSAPSGHRSKGLPTFSPLAQPLGCLLADFLWIAIANSTAFPSLNHIPPLPIHHGAEYPLGSRMYLGVVHPRLEARGRPVPRSPRSCSRVNLFLPRPWTRGPQGPSAPLRTPHSRPGVQGNFLTSRGQGPYSCLMVRHSMATGFPIPRGCCSVFSASPLPLFCNPATSLPPVPRPVTHHGLLTAPRACPFSRGCCAALAALPSLSGLLFPSSRVYAPPGYQQPSAQAHWILIHPETVLCV